MITIESYNNRLTIERMENVMESVNGQLQIKYQKIATEYSKVKEIFHISILFIFIFQIIITLTCFYLL